MENGWSPQKEKGGISLITPVPNPPMPPYGQSFFMVMGLRRWKDQYCQTGDCKGCMVPFIPDMVMRTTSVCQRGIH